MLVPLSLAAQLTVMTVIVSITASVVDDNHNEPGKDTLLLSSTNEHGVLVRTSVSDDVTSNEFAGNATRVSRRKRASSAVVKTGLTFEQRVRLIYDHNRLRKLPSATDMLFVTWKKSLAAVAEEYVKNCIFQHNANRSSMYGDGYAGENIWAITADLASANVTSAVESWYSEEPYYHYNNLTCDAGKACGHYTQVVWASSKYIGCGMAQCEPLSFPSGSTWAKATILFCNYAPGGNAGGVNPYQTGGAACSACNSSLQCDNGLCRAANCDGKVCQNNGVLLMDTCECNCTGTGSTSYLCELPSGAASSVIFPYILLFIALLFTCLEAVPLQL